MADTATAAAPAPTTTTSSPVAALMRSQEFLVLPTEEKIREIDKAAKQDVRFRNQDGPTRHAIVMRLLQTNTTDTPTAVQPGEVPATIGAPSPMQALGNVISQLTGKADVSGTPTQTLSAPQDTAAQDITALVPSALNQAVEQSPPGVRIPARAAVRGADVVPAGASFVANTLGSIAGPRGRPFPEIPRSGSNPMETSLAGDKGFSLEANPNLQLLQHVLDSAVGGAVGGVVLGKVFHLASQVPLTKVALDNALAGIQAALAGHAVKDFGPWAQLAAEIIAGGVPLTHVRSMLTAIAERPGLQRKLAESIQETTPNVEQNIQGFRDVQNVAPGYEGTLSQRTLSPDIASGEQSFAQSSPQARAAFANRQEGDIAAVQGSLENRLGPSGAVEPSLEQVQQTLQEPAAQAGQNLTQAQTAEEQARAFATTQDEAARTRRLYVSDVQTQTGETVEQAKARLSQVKGSAEDITTLSKKQAALQTQQAKEAVNAATANLDTITEQTGKNVAAATKAFTEESAALAPNLANLSLAEAEPRALANMRRIGNKVRTFYQKALNEFETWAENSYGELRKTTVGGDAGGVLDAIAELESTQAQRTQSRFTPTRVEADIRKTIAEKGGIDLGALQAEVDAQGTVIRTVEQVRNDALAAVQLNINDVRVMRSQVGNELRRTEDVDYQRALRALSGKLDGVMTTMAENAGDPEIIAKIHNLNDAYRTGISRFSYGPGADALALKPNGSYRYTNGQILDHVFDKGATALDTGVNENKLELFKTLRRDTAGDTSVQDAVRTMARQKFYLSSVDKQTGQLNPKLAQDWIRDHQAFLDADLQLKSMFYGEAQGKPSIAKLAQIARDAEAEAQVLSTQAQEQLTRVQDRATSVAATTSEAVRSVEEGTASRVRTAQEELAQVRQTAANKLRTARKEGQSIQEPATGTVRKGAQAEPILQEQAKSRVQIAQEARQTAQTEFDTAVKDYNANFGARDEARLALDNQAFTGQVGRNPRDMITFLEGLGEPARSQQYVKLFDAIGNDDSMRRAVLRAKYDHFLTQPGNAAQSATLATPQMLVSPEKAASFIEQNQAFLQAHYPGYVEDVNTLHEGFKRIAFAENATGVIPKEITQSTSRSRLIDGLTFGLFSRLIPGVNIAKSAVLTELFMGAEKLAANRKGALVSHLYLDPDVTQLMSHLAGNKPVNQTVLRTMLYSNLARLGLLTQIPENP